jgi:hypothetical protein
LDIDRGGTADCILLSGTQANGRTSIIYKRKFNTGDKNDYALAHDQYQFVAWATYKYDGSGLTYQQHDHTGNGMVNFSTGQSTSVNKLSADEIVIMVAILVTAFFALIRMCRKCCSTTVYKMVSFTDEGKRSIDL